MTSWNPIRRMLEAPHHLVIEPATLRDLRPRMEKQIKKPYLKQVHAPVGVTSVLKCWMELN